MRAQVRDEVVARQAKQKKLGRHELLLLARAMWQGRAGDDGLLLTLNPKLDKKQLDYNVVDKTFVAEVQKLDEAKLMRLVLFMAMDEFINTPYKGEPDWLLDTAQRLKVNVQAIEKQVTAQFDAPKAKPQEKPPAKPAKKGAKR